MNEIKSITIDENEEYLRQISKPVELESDTELTDNIAVLDNYCINNDVLAMAAVQLGIPKRIIYLKNTNIELMSKDEKTEEEKNHNERRILINPIITKKEGLTEYWEACRSCIDNCGLVLRPYRINVEYYDVLGQKHSEIFEGFESTVLSHEMDHLDGILHMDIAEEVLVMPKEERKIWRKTHGYKIYEKDGNYETLLSEKHKEKIDSLSTN